MINNGGFNKEGMMEQYASLVRMRLAPDTKDIDDGDKISAGRSMSQPNGATKIIYPLRRYRSGDVEGRQVERSNGKGLLAQ